MTEPIQGLQIEGVEKANDICSQTFGEGFRMASFHDGKFVVGMDESNYFGDSWPQEEQLQTGGWGWYAYGPTQEETRFWVNISDQPANCWD